MADDKTKKKIDLKARLGKSTLTGMTSPAALPIPGPGPSGSGLPPPDSGPGSSPSTAPGPAGTPIPAPTPSVRPPMPMGLAPPPGMSTGIPLPPFAPQSRPAAPKEAKPTAAQQTIKVEVGEEVHEQRKAATRNAAIAAVHAQHFANHGHGDHS